MSENPVPETLETIAAKIDALSKSVDRRFEESGARLGVKIEAVETKVTQVYDEVIAMRHEAKRNATEHKALSRGGSTTTTSGFSRSRSPALPSRNTAEI